MIYRVVIYKKDYPMSNCLIQKYFAEINLSSDDKRLKRKILKGILLSDETCMYDKELEGEGLLLVSITPIPIRPEGVEVLNLDGMNVSILKKITRFIRNFC